MARTLSPIKFVTFFSILIFAIFFLQMLFLGQTIGVSLFFSSIMGLLTAGLATMSYAYKGFLQRRSFAGKKQSDQSISNHQQRTVEIDLPMNTAFDLSMDALKIFDGKPVPVPDDWLVKLESILPRKQFLNIRESDKNQGIIRAGLKSKTLGLPNFIDFSRIDIGLEKIDAHTTRIHIESKANTFIDMYDLGKNLHYVNEIALYLRRESQQMQAESRLSDIASDTTSNLDDDNIAHQNQADQE